jgi:hypothetical protein
MARSEIKLNPNQLKTLNVFSHYCKGYGVKEVTREFFFQYGNEEWSDNDWSSPQLRTSIESYSSIDSLLEFLINEYKLYYMGDESDNQLNVTFDVDCVENVMSIYAFEEAYQYIDSGSESDADEDEDLLSFFTEMKNRGVSSATVDFSGGGDNGYINDTLTLSTGSNDDIPSGVKDFLYNMLNSHQGGWEIDDGSQGVFTFDFEEGKLILDFQLNTRENYKVDTEYMIYF